MASIIKNGINYTFGGGGGDVTVDSALSDTSENPVQNKVVKEALDGKLDTDAVIDADTVDGKRADEFMQFLQTADAAFVNDCNNTNYSVAIDGNVSEAIGLPDKIWHTIVNYATPATLNGYNFQVAYPISAGVTYNYKVFIRKSNGTSFGDWYNIADGGNADRLDGLHASDFLQINEALISNGTTVTTDAGKIYGIVGVTTSPYTCSKWIANLSSKITTPTHGMIICTRIPVAGCAYGVCLSINGNTQANYHPVVFNNNSGLATYLPAGVTTYLMYDANVAANAYFNSATATSVTGVWRVMTAINTTYGAASTTANGLMTTGSQTLAGAKFFQTDRFGIRMPNVTKGTAPSAAQYSRIMFQDNSGSNADTENLGMVYHTVSAANHSSIIIRATSSKAGSSANYGLTVTKLANDGEGFAQVSTPTSPARSCLRQLASGSAAPNDTNNPSGSWYGQHSGVPIA